MDSCVRARACATAVVLPSPQFPNAVMAPLYTFFIALQDVEDNMGHTTFIPRTHTPDAHLLWNLGQVSLVSLLDCARERGARACVRV